MGDWDHLNRASSRFSESICAISILFELVRIDFRFILKKNSPFDLKQIWILTSLLTEFSCTMLNKGHMDAIIYRVLPFRTRKSKKCDKYIEHDICSNGSNISLSICDMVLYCSEKEWITKCHCCWRFWDLFEICSRFQRKLILEIWSHDLNLYLVRLKIWVWYLIRDLS